MTTEEIRSRFELGYDCSQVVLENYAERYGMDINEARRVAAAFGGGMMQGEACGAFTGALMVIGLACGHNNPDTLLEDKNLLMEKSTAFRKMFLEKYGTCKCPGLLKYDLTKDGEFEKALESGRLLSFCPELVYDVMTMLDEIL